MIVDIQPHNRAILYVGSLTQMFNYIISGNTDNMLLTVMAYDWFVAMCHPLRYNVIMNLNVCVLLVLLSLISVLAALLHTFMALQLSFCTDLEIPHFFCELVDILRLAWSDIFINSILVCVLASLLGVPPLSGIKFLLHSNCVLCPENSISWWKA
jgi:olfactory receptor